MSYGNRQSGHCGDKIIEILVSTFGASVLVVRSLVWLLIGMQNAAFRERLTEGAPVIRESTLELYIDLC